MAGNKASVALFLAVNLVVLAMATPTLASSGHCPRDALKLGLCANLLGLIKAKVDVPPTEPCCPLLEGLVDAEAALCLCTAAKVGILGIKLNDLPVDLSLILYHCGITAPTGFKCL